MTQIPRLARPKGTRRGDSTDSSKEASSNVSNYRLMKKVLLECNKFARLGCCDSTYTRSHKISMHRLLRHKSHFDVRQAAGLRTLIPSGVFFSANSASAERDEDNTSTLLLLAFDLFRVTEDIRRASLGMLRSHRISGREFSRQIFFSVNINTLSNSMLDFLLNIALNVFHIDDFVYSGSRDDYERERALATRTPLPRPSRRRSTNGDKAAVFLSRMSSASAVMCQYSILFIHCHVGQ